MSFPKFKAKHGPGVRHADASAAVVNAWRGRLPDVLVDDWVSEGFCYYARGLLWIVDPGELAQALREWLPEGDGSLAIARTAFADVVLWDGAQISYLDVHYGRRFPAPGPRNLRASDRGGGRRQGRGRWSGAHLAAGGHRPARAAAPVVRPRPAQRGWSFDDPFGAADRPGVAAVIP